MGSTLELLGSVQGTGSSATLQFTGIPTDTQSFVLRGLVSESSSGAGILALRFNSDSGSRYAGRQYFYASSGGSMSSGAYNTVYTYLRLIDEIPGTSENVGYGRAQFESEIYSLAKQAESPGSPAAFTRWGTEYGDRLGWTAGAYAYTEAAPTATDVTTMEITLGSGGNFPTTTYMSLYKRPAS